MCTELAVARGSLNQRLATRNVLVLGASTEMDLKNGSFTELRGVWQFEALSKKAYKITLNLTFNYTGPPVKATLRPLFARAANIMVDTSCQRAKQLYG